MIILDIETSGIDKMRCGVWQIGAIDLNNPKEFFLQEGRIDEEDEIVNSGKKPVLEVIGKTEEELRNKKKQSQKELLINFFKWIEQRPILNFLCQNPQFDVAFLEIKAMRYGLKIPFHYRSFDLHSFAQKKYFDLNGNFLIKERHSDMGLKNILNFCGMQDNREAHNALEDCKLTGECFSRIVFGRNLFEEFSKFEIPDYLKK
jgi:DNA polymerase III epsilon subunit-like protein